MIKRQTLKKIGGSVATVLPKTMLDRFHLNRLAAGKLTEAEFAAWLREHTRPSRV